MRAKTGMEFNVPIFRGTLEVLCECVEQSTYIAIERGIVEKELERGTGGGSSSNGLAKDTTP